MNKQNITITGYSLEYSVGILRISINRFGNIYSTSISVWLQCSLLKVRFYQVRQYVITNKQEEVRWNYLSSEQLRELFSLLKSVLLFEATRLVAERLIKRSRGITDDVVQESVKGETQSINLQEQRQRRSILLQSQVVQCYRKRDVIPDFKWYQGSSKAI